MDLAQVDVDDFTVAMVAIANLEDKSPTMSMMSSARSSAFSRFVLVRGGAGRGHLKLAARPAVKESSYTPRLPEYLLEPHDPQRRARAHQKHRDSSVLLG